MRRGNVIRRRARNGSGNYRQRALHRRVFEERGFPIEGYVRTSRAHREVFLPRLRHRVLKRMNFCLST